MQKKLILFGFISLIIIFAYVIEPRTNILRKGREGTNTLSQPNNEITRKTQPQQSKNIWDNVIVRIDDGPDQYTSELVKTLKELGIKHAIFGLIGRNVLQYPNTVQEIMDAGYIIANHTFTHPRMHLRMVRAYYIHNPDKWKWQIARTTKAINQVLKPKGKSYQCKNFCCPELPRYLPMPLLKIVKEQGLELDRGWDIDSRDSIKGRKRLTLEQMVSQISYYQNKKDVVEVLIHSGKGGWSERLREIDKALTNLKENKNKKQIASLT